MFELPPNYTPPTELPDDLESYQKWHERIARTNYYYEKRIDSIGDMLDWNLCAAKGIMDAFDRNYDLASKYKPNQLNWQMTAAIRVSAYGLLSAIMYDYDGYADCTTKQGSCKNLRGLIDEIRSEVIRAILAIPNTNWAGFGCFDNTSDIEKEEIRKLVYEEVDGINAISINPYDENLPDKIIPIFDKYYKDMTQDEWQQKENWVMLREFLNVFASNNNDNTNNKNDSISNNHSKNSKSAPKETSDKWKLIMDDTLGSIWMSENKKYRAYDKDAENHARNIAIKSNENGYKVLKYIDERMPYCFSGGKYDNSVELCNIIDHCMDLLFDK